MLYCLLNSSPNELMPPQQPLIGTISDSHLKHGQDFIDRMRSLGNCSGKMCSLDVTSLFTNVPLNFVLENLKKRFEDGVSPCP